MTLFLSFTADLASDTAFLFLPEPYCGSAGLGIGAGGREEDAAGVRVEIEASIRGGGEASGSHEQ